MKTFDRYSRYYNLLYGDKDYTREADYVDDLIKRNLSGAKSILDLGCGTGLHDFLLAEKGYSVTGVDISGTMLGIAASRLRSQETLSKSLSFIQGDIRTIKLTNTFDVVLSLFHVMSYQVSNDDIVSTLTTVRDHLKPGGLFIFDCWYGPAVLTERPTTRLKRLEDDEINLVRIAEPIMHPNDNTVDVNYHVLIKDKRNNSFEELKEKHVMRYLFKPEMELFIENSGLQLLTISEWMTGNDPGFDTWSVCFVVRACEK